MRSRAGSFESSKCPSRWDCRTAGTDYTANGNSPVRLRTGFVDAGVPNPDISDVVDKEYYRDVAHAPAYIKRDWSAILDVVEIIPGGFGNVHDAIVLRRRGE